jgi:hypothetical protein
MSLLRPSAAMNTNLSVDFVCSNQSPLSQRARFTTKSTALMSGANAVSHTPKLRNGLVMKHLLGKFKLQQKLCLCD